MSYDANIEVWIDDGDNGKAAMKAFVDYTIDWDNNTGWSIEDSDDDSASGAGQSFDADDVAAVLAPIAEKYGVTFGVWYKNDFDDECTVHIGSKAKAYMLKARCEEAAEALRQLDSTLADSSKDDINAAVAMLDKRDADTLNSYSRKFQGN